MESHGFPRREGQWTTPFVKNDSEVAISIDSLDGNTWNDTIAVRDMVRYSGGYDQLRDGMLTATLAARMP